MIAIGKFEFQFDMQRKNPDKWNHVKEFFVPGRKKENLFESKEWGKNRKGGRKSN